ncbi:hypothetical protein [Rickettsia prowazekii]|uniref:hypothetical protein n=1 Tax=Rickettsia prowazekii TaxID=782 RepID=UPI0009B5E5B0|nr:hypothetical protein [Rickettsia prowazekii]
MKIQMMILKKNAIKLKVELENAQKDINQAKKNLENAEAKNEALQRQIILNHNQNEVNSHTTKNQEKFKTDNVTEEYLEDMALMFKNSEDTAEQKEEVNCQHHEEQNIQKQEHINTEEEAVHKEKIIHITEETETEAFKKEIDL